MIDQTKTPVEKKWYTSNEVAALLGISIHTLPDWVLRGKLPQPVKHGDKKTGRRLFPRDVIDEMVAKMQSPTNTPA
jgi:predicted site-specific integrase-resolvase